MVRTLHFIVIVTMMALFIGELRACEVEQAHNGCKIISYTCTCGFGCKSEYRYSSKEECRNALKERGNNVCSRVPCRNKGTCIQITQDPGFKCRCENTGFYGNRCERACPSAGGSGGIFPYECVVI